MINDNSYSSQQQQEWPVITVTAALDNSKNDQWQLLQLSTTARMINDNSYSSQQQQEWSMITVTTLNNSKNDQW